MHLASEFADSDQFCLTTHFVRNIFSSFSIFWHLALYALRHHFFFRILTGLIGSGEHAPIRSIVVPPRLHFEARAVEGRHCFIQFLFCHFRPASHPMGYNQFPTLAEFPSSRIARFFQNSIRTFINKSDLFLSLAYQYIARTAVFVSDSIALVIEPIRTASFGWSFSKTSKAGTRAVTPSTRRICHAIRATCILFAEGICAAKAL